jgi:hypothetical protein
MILFIKTIFWLCLFEVLYKMITIGYFDFPLKPRTEQDVIGEIFIFLVFIIWAEILIWG